MKVEWTPQAQLAVYDIISYIDDNFGSQSVVDIANEIAENERYLTMNPYMFPKEPLLEKHTLEYHSVIVNKLSKIIYRIDKDIVYIVDFWNLRQNPKRLQNRIKD